MIYRPTDRTASRGAERQVRELAAVLVAVALLMALILQFACAGADPVRWRWYCPNNARLARLAEASPTPLAEPAGTAEPGAGAGIWTAVPSIAPPPTLPPTLPFQDFGAPETQFATPILPGVDVADPFVIPPTSTPARISPPSGLDDRTSAILGTATALSATATARASDDDAPTPAQLPFPDPATPTPDEGGYP